MRVGVPRALLYYEYYPMWQAFLAEAGMEVVVSPTTTQETIASGCARVIPEICLPVRVFAGHALWLADKCDAVLIPAVHSRHQATISCPKFIGLPDLIKARVPECPTILDPDIDANRGEGYLRDAFQELGRLLGLRRRKAKEAASIACEAHEASQAAMRLDGMIHSRAMGELSQQTREEDGHGAQGHSVAVALVGHPYLLQDDAINYGLVPRLREMGADLSFPEMIEDDELRERVRGLGEEPYWSSEGEVLGAGLHHLDSDSATDGVIAVSAFGCGPDAMMVDVLRRRTESRNKPLLCLTLDQHTAEGGLVTRLEAFVDMIQRGRKSPVRRSPAVGGGTIQHREPEPIRVLSAPAFGNLAVAVRASAEMLGGAFIAPPITKRTLTLGARHSPESACLPFKAFLGNFIECLDQGSEVLFMGTSSNGCRMGYFARAHEQILRDLGYEFTMFRFRRPERGLLGVMEVLRRYTDRAPWSLIFSAYRLAATKLIALDRIEQAVQRMRPMELEQGAADRIYRRAIHAVDEARERSTVRRVEAEALREIDGVPADADSSPLVVGIVGELFVVTEPFANGDVEIELGKLGVEVRRTVTGYFSEWTKFGGFMNLLTNEKRKLEKFARPYLKRDVGGHGLESLAETVRRAGEYDGIVHLLPFTCIPESIAAAIMPSTGADMPVLTIMCDEQMDRAGRLTRLEAFVDLLRRRRDRSRS